MTDLYKTIVDVVPEPGIKENEVRKLVEDAQKLGQGVIEYFNQATSMLVREVMQSRNTYHETINDFDFFMRARNALKAAEQNP